MNVKYLTVIQWKNHENSKKHQKFIKNQTINIAGNNYNITINITVNDVEDLKLLELDFLKAINK